MGGEKKTMYNSDNVDRVNRNKMIKTPNWEIVIFFHFCNWLCVQIGKLKTKNYTKTTCLHSPVH